MLQLLSWWIALGSAPLAVLAGTARPSGAGERSGFPDGLQLIAHEGSAVAIGRAFLRENPAEADGHALRVSLELATEDPVFPTHEARRTEARLRSTHREDFVEGRVRELGGFTFSVTELRLSALVALEKARSR